MNPNPSVLMPDATKTPPDDVATMFPMIKSAPMMPENTSSKASRFVTW